MTHRVLVVTDPMCSWCWGMSGAVEEAAHLLGAEVVFDVLLGGINTHATQPIGEFGRRHLMKLWGEVHATTAQPFGYQLPDDFVYNSTLPCVAIEAFRRRLELAPFGFLHRLQQCLFVEGRDINSALELDRIAQEFGWEANELADSLSDEALIASARKQFETSRIYGTSALPNVVVEDGGDRRLLFGGYADSEMMVMLIRQAFATA